MYEQDQIDAMEYFYAVNSPTQAEIESQQDEYAAYMERSGYWFTENPVRRNHAAEVLKNDLYAQYQLYRKLRLAA